ncbi:hypothetical protein PIB30_016790 [Stylosanthes scabra]|uniref:Uncharacterized protein n=1 Tax=Stylosanthes scabra TaxID=79078 RepID=A0ABU6R7P4_9FABA|nr:hypothetical protein [Stylosanthes scabra]
MSDLRRKERCQERRWLLSDDDVEERRSLFLNFQKAGAGRGLVRVSAICSDAEFEKKVLYPLHFREDGCECLILRLRRAAADGGLLGAFPRDEVGAVEHVEAGGGLSVIKVTSPV